MGNCPPPSPQEGKGKKGDPEACLSILLRKKRKGEKWDEFQSGERKQRKSLSNYPPRDERRGRKKESPHPDGTKG